MIKAADLRKGNIVYYLHDGKKHLTNIYAVLEMDRSDYDPVPITADLLAKCGFEGGKKYAYKFGELAPVGIGVAHKDEVAQKDFGTEYVLTILDGTHPSFRKGVNYLHELQNIFYVITGEELDVSGIELEYL